MFVPVLTSLLLAAQTLVTPTVMTARVVGTFPHETDAFTQGLLFADGVLIESTGLEGHSRLRKLSMKTGKPVQEIMFPDDVFAEGTALVGDKLVTLTYRNEVGYVFDLETFEEVATFEYEGEGWGLTYDGERLIMSDGTAELRFLDPETFEERGRKEVTLSGQPLTRINELEMIEGKLWANIWGQDFLVQINPDSGVVETVADLRNLFPREERKAPASDVLNGIAYEEGSKRLFVTGKNWPQIFEITFEPR
ncbi:MAG: glutaminyl-peptide cyclotransferase [Parvularcula sp.]|jgi:glutamine cyclotransferase|nr:glutaminyl-peptide cyclotransferase [Parvularcula sp.]